MSHRFSAHLFWGSHSPLYSLSGAGLIIMTSSRFSFALVCSSALLWVFGLTALIYSGARSIMPVRGKMIILLFISAFLCGLFALIASLINPLLILGTGFFLFLIPPWCLGSGLFESSGTADPFEVFSRAILEAITMAVIILGLSLIREPLGMGTISIPGGIQGTAEFVFSWNEDSFFPARILSVSSGGLLLLGYGTALYRYYRDQTGIPEDN